MIFEFHILTTSYCFGHPALVVEKLYNYSLTSMRMYSSTNTYALVKLYYWLN